MGRKKVSKPKTRPGDVVTEELNDDDIKEREEEAARDAEEQPSDERAEKIAASIADTNERYSETLDKLADEEAPVEEASPAEDLDAEMAKLYPQMMPKFFGTVREFATEQQAIATKNGYRSIAHDWAAFINMADRLQKKTETDYWSKKFHEQ